MGMWNPSSVYFPGDIVLRDISGAPFNGIAGGSAGPFYNMTGVNAGDPAQDITNWMYLGSDAPLVYTAPDSTAVNGTLSSVSATPDTIATGGSSSPSTHAISGFVGGRYSKFTFTLTSPATVPSTVGAFNTGSLEVGISPNLMIGINPGNSSGSVTLTTPVTLTSGALISTGYTNTGETGQAPGFGVNTDTTPLTISGTWTLE